MAKITKKILLLLAPAAEKIGSLMCVAAPFLGLSDYLLLKICKFLFILLILYITI
jgi:hypothetical protein